MPQFDPNENIPYEGQSLGANPWSQFSDNWLFHSSDNYFNGGALYQALNPGEAQYSEWSQQMVSTMYQNWYNSAPEQMKRALAAGINPFVAASGIAGNGAGSVAAAPPSLNNSAAPAMLSAAGSALGSVGSAFGNVASGIATLAKYRHEIANIDQSTASEFEKMGFTKLQSQALTTQLKYLDEKEQISVWQALADFDKTKQEYQNLVATHNNILAQYDEIIAHKDLLIQEQGEVSAREQVNKAMEDKLKAESDWQKIQNDFFTAHGYVIGSPIFESIRDMMVSNGTFDMESFGNTVAGYKGKVAYVVSSNQYQADAESAYARAHNAGMGSYDSDPYQQQYRQLYDMVDTLSNQEEETVQLLSALKSAHDEGKISDEEYKVQQGKLLKLQREIRKSSEALNKHLAKMNYSVGHSSQLQEIKGDLVKIGVAFGLYSVGKSSPTQIKGFTGR